LTEMETLPAWADFDLMAKGGAMGFRQFPQLSLALMHGGLLMTFAAPESARILAGTNRLEQNVVRRLFESSTLFFGVLDTEALRPGGVAWETCLKVRLMHSMVRMRLLAAGEWDEAQDGKPINLLHIAAGPLFFGSMVLDSLRKLGARVTAEEALGYKLLWRYVTWLLGVPQELLGHSDAEQEAINARILPLAFGPDANSLRLTEALMRGLGHMPPLQHLPRGFHEALSRRLLGPALADGLRLADDALMQAMVSSMVLGLRGYGLMLRLPGMAPRAAGFGKRYMEDFLERGLGGVAADFQEHPR
ncbi:MAG TPA: oxygenase MpaB family protein, partial [Moraxellaceae bacterium]